MDKDYEKKYLKYKKKYLNLKQKFLLGGTKGSDGINGLVKNIDTSDIDGYDGFIIIRHAMSCNNICKNNILCKSLNGRDPHITPFGAYMSYLFAGDKLKTLDLGSNEVDVYVSICIRTWESALCYICGIYKDKENITVNLIITPYTKEKDKGQYDMGNTHDVCNAFTKLYLFVNNPLFLKINENKKITNIQVKYLMEDEECPVLFFEISLKEFDKEFETVFNDTELKEFYGYENPVDYKNKTTLSKYNSYIIKYNPLPLQLQLFSGVMNTKHKNFKKLNNESNKFDEYNICNDENRKKNKTLHEKIESDAKVLEKSLPQKQMLKAKRDLIDNTNNFNVKHNLKKAIDIIKNHKSFEGKTATLMVSHSDVMSTFINRRLGIEKKRGLSGLIL